MKTPNELLVELNVFRVMEGRTPFADWHKARHTPMLEAYRATYTRKLPPGFQLPLPQKEKRPQKRLKNKQKAKSIKGAIPLFPSVAQRTGVTRRFRSPSKRNISDWAVFCNGLGQQ